MTSTGPATPPPYQPSGPRPLVILIALVVILTILFLAAMLYIVLSEDKSPTGVYKEYVDALNDKDAERMFDQTVTRFTPDYEENIDDLAAVAFLFNPEIEIHNVGVTYQDDLTIGQELVAEIFVADLEYELSVEVEEYCIVDYTITLTYTDLDESDTQNGEVYCVKIDGHWYLALPLFY